jgi:hypothetical protein
MPKSKALGLNSKFNTRICNITEHTRVCVQIWNWRVRNNLESSCCAKLTYLSWLCNLWKKDRSNLFFFWIFPGLSLATFVLPVFLACFGPLVVGQNCPYPDPLDHSVLFPDKTDCSRFFICSNGKPVSQNCPSGLHFNDDLKTCDYPINAKCVAREFFSILIDCF